jgi:hypothetical protein
MELEIGNDKVDVTEHLVVVVPDAGITTEEVGYPAGCVVLDIEYCIYHVDRVIKFHDKLPDLVERVTGSEFEYADRKRRSSWSLGMRHLVGCLDMTLKFLDAGVSQIAWRFPESGLHPKWQVELADVAIELSKRMSP